MFVNRFQVSICFFLLCFGLLADAKPALVAVATNFYTTADSLVDLFEEDHAGHEVTLVSGSTGQLYAQIQNGAPFDVLLAADTERVDLAVENGLAVPESRFTYALGRLSFVTSVDLPSMTTFKSLIEDFDISRLAIANPRVAPYGVAAEQVLTHVGYEFHNNITLRAENISQAFTMVSTGNANAGLVAYSHVLRARYPENRFCLVPQDLHKPIRQDAVLLTHGFEDSIAKSFLRFLRSAKARELISKSGYSVIEPN